MEEWTDDELLVNAVISNKMDVILGRIREYSHDPTSEQYLQLASKIQKLMGERFNEQHKSSPFGPNIFELISFYDTLATIYGNAGEEGYDSWCEATFQLANYYSDQAGLERKFQLYRDVIDSTRHRAKQNQTSEYYFTRSLNRLGQLTEEWCDEGDAYDIWNELYAYANESMDEEEKELTIKEIHRNAPWFQPEDNAIQNL